MGKIKWTLEACIKDAKKYKTKGDWREFSHSCYTTAVRNKWLTNCCGHMLSTKEAKTKWTLDICKKAGLKFKTKTDFIKNNPAAYDATIRNNWTQIVCSHMVILKRKWTLDDLMKDAEKYDTKKQWREKNPSGYTYAYRRNWIEACSNHMLLDNWDFQSCQKEALKYKTRSEWLKKGSGSYNYARKNGLISKLSTHMIKAKKWTLTACQKDAKKYTTRNQWHQSKGGYEMARLNGWVEICCAHMPQFANQNRKEDRLARPKYIKLFKKHKVSFKEQFKLGSKKIDFVFFINNKNYGLEIKHDDLKYSYTKKQIKSYRQLGNLSQYNLKKVILSSPKGRHGISIKELESLIKSLK